MKELKPSDIKLLVIHCSATKCNRPFSVENLIATGMAKFGQPSYHYYIRRNGDIVPILPESVRGAHAKHYNKCSLGICYEGGLDAQGCADDTRTEAQKASMFALLKNLTEDYPEARIIGHNELPKQRVPIELVCNGSSRDGSGRSQFPHVAKDCPCFLASEYYRSLQPENRK